jgi:hypothetical protein
MNRKSIVLAGVLMMVGSMSVMATTPSPAAPGLPEIWGPTPPIPSIYSDGLTRLQLPNLSVPERAAFSQIEAAQQLAETYVQANGCITTTAGVDLYAARSGVGDMTITTPGGSIKLAVSQTAVDNFRGDQYTVASELGFISGLKFTGVLAKFNFNKPGSIMEGSAVASVTNPQAPTIPDVFKARIIKDFFAFNQLYPVSRGGDGNIRTFYLDWGLGVLNKKDYPVAKWFQRSWSLRDDGVPGRIVFQKTRIAGGSACRIQVSTSGFNNYDNVNQQGFLKIYPVVVGPNVR